MVNCSTCDKTVLVIHKRIKCTNSNCNNHYHLECVNFNETTTPRVKWICPVCPKKDDLETPEDLLSTHAILMEIRNMRADMNKKFEDQQLMLQGFNDKLSHVQRDIQNLDSKFASMRTELNYLTESVTFLSSAHDAQVDINTSNKAALSGLLTENENLRKQISEMDSKLGQLEQQARQCNIEIQCVPENKSENLLTIINQLAKTVSLDIADNEVLNFHRVAKLNRDSQRPRNIVVKLASPRSRDNFLSAVKVFNKKNAQEKLNSSHLGFAGEKIPIYVQEHLSPANKKLHAAARVAAKEKKYEFVWVRNGHVFVCKDNQSQTILIRNVETLKNL